MAAEEEGVRRWDEGGKVQVQKLTSSRVEAGGAAVRKVRGGRQKGQKCPG